MSLYGIVDEGSEFGFVAEYCSNGSLYLLMSLLFNQLYDVLNYDRDVKLKNKVVLSAMQSIEYAVSLANVINVLHAKKIAHRDIKSGNIMV